MPPLPFESTRFLGGRYQINQRLGTGGFGHTFLARDLHLPGHPQCVVKQLKPQVNSSQELQVARRLFDTEAQTLYRLGSHPQIPNLLAHFEEQQEFYLVQELIEGQGLEDELATSLPWSDEGAIAFLRDLLSTLAFVHDHGIIHRDIKPSNLIRRQHDNRIVLIDFGAVKQVGTQISSGVSGVSRTISIGTQGYMPNEQIAGRPQFSSDVYAVGMVAIQGLTGHHPDRIQLHPQTGELDWHGVAPQASAALIALLDYMVCYDFRSRYATATEALTALQATFPEQSGAKASAYGDQAFQPASASHLSASPSRAVPTVAIGRHPPQRPEPESSIDRMAATPRSRRSRSSGSLALPLGLGTLVIVGLGLLTWQVYRPAPTPEAAAPITNTNTTVVPESGSESGAPIVRPVPEAEEGAQIEPEPEPTVAAAAADLETTEPETAEPETESTVLPPRETEPEPNEPAPAREEAGAAPLTPALAQDAVGTLYNHVSSQSWEAARGMFGEALAQQFDPGFFEQFQQVTVDNLRVTEQTADTVQLVGQNTYRYPDGSTQQEERTFTVQMVNGQPRIVGSSFVQVLKPRGND